MLAFSSAQLVGIVAGWCIVQVGVNMMIAPAVAVLSDRIPENVRGTFSAFYGGRRSSDHPPERSSDRNSLKTWAPDLRSVRHCSQSPVS